MSEEIDIIELLKRVKEEKAPKRIEINGTKYEFNEDSEDVACIYREGYGNWLELEAITLDTKIKILDKSIIEELPMHPIEVPEGMIIEEVFANKINEIIRYINKEEK